MAISNSQKRRLACRFCPRHKSGCQCKKYWKEIYKIHREEILKIYHSNKSPSNI